LVLDYEVALHPELTLYTDTQSVLGELTEVVRLAVCLHRAALTEQYKATVAESGDRDPGRTCG